MVFGGTRLRPMRRNGRREPGVSTNNGANNSQNDSYFLSKSSIHRCTVLLTFAGIILSNTAKSSDTSELSVHSCIKTLAFAVSGAGLSTGATQATTIKPDNEGKGEKAHKLNSYEKQFVSALSHYEEGNYARAASIWDGMLIESPTNLLCLRATHFAYEMAGDFANLRDMIPRILLAWNDTMPGDMVVELAALAPSHADRADQ